MCNDNNKNAAKIDRGEQCFCLKFRKSVIFFDLKILEKWLSQLCARNWNAIKWKIIFFRKGDKYVSNSEEQNGCRNCVRM